MTSASPAPQRPAPLGAVITLTVLASTGTGVIWNGLPFIAKHEFGYTQTQSVLLYLTIGTVYVFAAFFSGRLLKQLRMAPRTMLAVVLVAQTVLCAGPLVLDGAWFLWVVGIMNTVLSAFLWPIIEAYLTAGRHGTDMRRAIGWWNISWTTAVASTLVVMAPLLEFSPDSARFAIVGFGMCNAVGLFVLPWLTAHPMHHDEVHSSAAVPPGYVGLLQAARVLLPLSYLLKAALAPLMPYLLQELHVAAGWQTIITAIYLFSRTISMAVMWRVRFWHGRWGTLVLGGGLMCLGFAGVAWPISLATMIMGLVTFGAGIGIVYYAAIYYAMAVGRAEIDAGGVHESLVGLGYGAGPAVVLVGMQLGTEGGAGLTGSQAGWVVGLAWASVAVGGALTVRIWRRAPGTPSRHLTDQDGAPRGP